MRPCEKKEKACISKLFMLSHSYFVFHFSETDLIPHEKFLNERKTLDQPIST